VRFLGGTKIEMVIVICGLGAFGKREEKREICGGEGAGQKRWIKFDWIGKRRGRVPFKKWVLGTQRM